MSAVSERPLTLAQIAANIPGARGSKNLNPGTLTRWILQGCTARSGEKIRLAATRAGSRWLVQQADLDAFFAALAADPAAVLPVTTPRSETKAKKAKKSSQAAGRKLENMGA